RFHGGAAQPIVEEPVLEVVVPNGDRLPLLLAVAVDERVREDPIHPRLEVRPLFEAGESPIGAQVGLLHEVIRVGRVPGHPKRPRWPGFGLGGGGTGPEGPKRVARTSPLIWILGVLAVLLLLRGLVTSSPPMDFSTFLSKAQSHQILTLNVSATDLSGTYRDPNTGGPVVFKTVIPPNYDPTPLIGSLQRSGVKITGEQPNAFCQVLIRAV